MSSISLMPTISVQVAGVANLAALPPANTLPIGSVRVTLNDGALYVSDGTTWNAAGGGGGGGVTSVNGLTGVVTVQVGDGTIPVTGGTSCLLWSDGSSESAPLPNWGINSDLGFQMSTNVNPDDLNGRQFSNFNLNFIPLQNSPDESWNTNNYSYNIDPTSTGFSFGVNGNALTHMGVNISHLGTSDLGVINFFSQNFQIGNGTDAIDFRGLSYMYGFGNVNNNVTLTGPFQGYGFQFNLDAGVVCDPLANVYVSGFYDACNINGVFDGSYTSFQAGPTIDTITNGKNYQGLIINPNIDTFQGNAGINCISVNPTVGSMGYGSFFSGININPNTSTSYGFIGVNCSVDNVTTFPGAAASLVFQDLTFTRNGVGEDGNSITIEYVGGGTAGSEVVSNIGLAFTVQIEDGVSTATQVKAALDANGTWGPAVTTTISGTASNPQTIAGPTNFTGGLWAGQKLAGYFDGDVEITGNLSFSGGLSIGALNSFGPYSLVSGTGNPQSVSTLITAPSVGDNQTLTSADLLGVNTAMLLNVGVNSSISTGFLGVTALGLPAVVGLGSGSTIDRVGGAVFAVSLDVTSTGGTINTMSLCRSLALPNGVTTVDRVYGYEFDLPFGDPATDSWGLYINAGTDNYLKTRLVVGTTDQVTNANCGIELVATDRAIRVSNMTTTERDAMTPLAGMIIFNTTVSALQYYDGSAWV